MRDDETLTQLLDEFDEAERRDAAGHRRSRPRHTRSRCRTTCRGSRRTSTTGRCAGWRLHLIEELARHAGHADIIRETIDGATMYELMAAQRGMAGDRLDQVAGGPRQATTVSR